MRSSKMSLTNLLAIAAILGRPMTTTTTTTTEPPKGYRPTPPKLNTKLQREIAEHNTRIEQAKYDKKLAKLKKRLAQEV